MPDRRRPQEPDPTLQGEDSTELRERLFVAERVMRTLFERNKVLEQQSENCPSCELLKAQIAQNNANEGRTD